MHYCIRLADNNDQESIMNLMKAHALFEGHKIEETIHHQRLAELNSLPVSIFVVEENQQLLGYMSVLKQFSTWDMNWYLYLDCLYLTEETRGHGLGLKMMEHLKSYGKENGIHSVQWQTPITNLPAIGFYQKLGAVNKEKQRFLWEF
jgi:ribosomal protein S18 acetylase RimI-like enzyme